MTVGLLVLDCIIPGSHSLKEKRHVLTAVTERLRRSFNAAVCEVEYQDKWQRARLAVAVVNTEWRMAESQMSKILSMLERDRRLAVVDSAFERLA